MPPRTLQTLVEESLVIIENGYVKLTRTGKTLADSVAGELIG